MSSDELDGDWQSGTKRRELYDSNGVLSSVLDFGWDAVLGQWNETSLSEFFLDASGRRIVTLRYNYESDWVLFQKSETSYDELDREIEKINYSPDGEQWLEESRKVLSEDYEWNTETGAVYLQSEKVLPACWGLFHSLRFHLPRGYVCMER